MIRSTPELPRNGAPAGLSASRISEEVVIFGIDLRAREPEIAATLARRITQEVDYIRDDPQLAELRIASVHANVATMIEILANDIPVHHLQPPIAALEYARRAAQREIPSHFLVRSYHLGQNSMMRICHDEIGRRNLPGDLGLAVIERLTDIVHSYADWITLYVLETYEAERKRWMNVRGTMHSAAVHTLLAAAAPDRVAFEAETGYRLDRMHLALIAWYSGSNEAEALTVLDTGIERVARAVDSAGPALSTAIDRRTLWAWCPLNKRPAAGSAELNAAVDLPADMRLAVGLVGDGAEGFRRSHQQAAAAYFVATVPGIPPEHRLTGFGDPGVAVVSLLAKDLAATREWVHETLGELAENTEQAAMLRDTLRTFYETGNSHLHTAKKMTLHRNTVKYRITKALAATGTAGTPHETLDIALALRICRFLGAKVLR
ncbi:PucR family transcriptional regulator [Nocardia carnea]|uniref:PucR family transcriptional regulator n=1 Tax=Nocardia carnea TaxID=37328 RepID=UPI002453F8D5|nr:helix-turn-helix domain-containing protein [Nocardia carnea]